METVNAAGETVDANGTVIWFVPNRLGTAVVEIFAVDIVRALYNYFRGVDDIWTKYVPLLLNARTTRERDLSEGPEEADLEAAFRRALLGPNYSVTLNQRAP